MFMYFLFDLHSPSLAQSSQYWLKSSQKSQMSQAMGQLASIQDGLRLHSDRVAHVAQYLGGKEIMYYSLYFFGKSKPTYFYHNRAESFLTWLFLKIDWKMKMMNSLFCNCAVSWPRHYI